MTANNYECGYIDELGITKTISFEKK